MLDDFADAADVGGDDGDFAGHGFEGGEAEGFELGRKKEKIGGSELFVDVVLFPEEKDVLLKFFSCGPDTRGAAVRAIADEDELGGHLGPDEGENFDGVGEALDGAEIRKMHEDGFAVGSPFSRKSFCRRCGCRDRSSRNWE